MMKPSCLLVAAFAVSVCGIAAGQAVPGPTPVLDLDCGSFSAFMVWRTPSLVDDKGQPQPLLEAPHKGVANEDRKPVPVRESLMPANLAAVEFDDSDWCRMRGQAVVTANAGDWHLVSLRGKFTVDDPGKVGRLSLAVSYHGGVRIFVNGAELIRGHLDEGDITADALALPYSADAYLRPDGKPYGPNDAKDQTLAARLASRVRSLPDGQVVIPAKLLRKGLNVVAIENHASAISAVAMVGARKGRSLAEDVWPHVGVISCKLSAASADGLTPNVGPLPGLRIATIAQSGTIIAGDYAHPSDAVQPVRIAGPVNGTCSGRLLLSSSETIAGLSASAGEFVLQGGSGKLPPAAVQIRWAEPSTPAVSWLPAGRFDRLLADPPAEVKPLSPPAKSPLKPSAVVPVWIIVNVPADTPAGNYRGTVTIKSGSPAADFAMPVELTIYGCRAPDPRDFAVFNFIYPSPDSVAMYYNVPLWSDRHLELVGRSLRLLAQAGSRACVLNLVVGAHGHGNSESMVLWVKKDDGTYEYDFTPAEKYMDAFTKVVGKPAIVQVNAWMFGGDNPEKPKWPPESVTVVDKDGKRLDKLQQPPYGTPENEAFWRPVLIELRKRLEKRGWWDVTRLGWLDYCRAPNKGITETAKKIWPDAKWIKHSHNPDVKFLDMPVTHNSWVWGVGAPYDPDCVAPWGKRTEYFPAGRGDYPRPWDVQTTRGFVSMGIPRWGAGFARPGLYHGSPLARPSTISESALQGNLLGMGMVGGDFWPLPGPRNRMYTICSGMGGVTATNSTLAMLSPGPDGAIENERFQLYREGLQIAEAIIFLRKLSLDAATDKELASRINCLLDERARNMMRNQNPQNVGPGNDPGYWLTGECIGLRRLNGQLFSLAAEVAGAK